MARLPVFDVMVPVDARRRPVLLAEGMDVIGIGKHAGVGREHRLRKAFRRRTPLAHGVADHGVRCPEKQLFREWFRLGKQAPRPET